MRHHYSQDIDDFRRAIARKRNVLAVLLAHARRCFDAREVGSVFGTDDSGERFLPPAQWDRGVMDRFEGRGLEGIALKLAGPLMMKALGLSPIRLFDRDELGQRHPAEGITAYALRHHQDFYDQGVKILLAQRRPTGEGADSRDSFSVSAYDGRRFSAVTDVRADTRIAARFRARNFIAAYIPDYGAIVFNTVQAFTREDGRFIFGPDLRQGLDFLILAIESASLQYLARARGRSAARLIMRKERRLRETASRLAEKEAVIREREAHLLAVGGVSARQLSMAATAVHDGVFAFMDMAGSVSVRRGLTPREYVFVLNLCHEIAAEKAQKFGCRVDNFMGDAVFFETLSVFDAEISPGLEARLMRMVCLLASVLGDIHDLARGRHPLDREMRASDLLDRNGLTLGFRAGMNYGGSLVGPLGSRRRRIVTAIGEDVDLASRLESSGRVNHIHVTGRTAGILKETWVSEDTPLVYDFARQVLAGRPGWAGRRGFSFLAFYRDWRGLGPEVVKRRKKAACFKEFSQAGTCLIPCLAEPRLPNTCPGI